MDRVISVVVIDDHEVVVDGVRSWFAAAVPTILVVASGDSVSRARTAPGADADVIVLDLQLRGTGVAEFGELRKLAQDGRNVVVHTQDTDPHTAVRCIKLGAAGFVAKSEGREHLVAAVRAAAEGQEYYTPPSLSGSILTDDDPARPSLSRMEEESLRAWFQCPSKEMAARMVGIKPKTMDGYIQRVRLKYDAVGRPARTKSALVHRALEDGLVTFDELEPGEI